MQFLPKRITNISGMGDVLVYDIIDDDGNTFCDSMISLDKKYVRPSYNSPSMAPMWYSLEIKEFSGEITYVFKLDDITGNARRYVLYDEVLKLVDDALFEKEVLSDE